MTFVPAQTLDKTAFGELAVSEPSPIVQIAAVNGIRENVKQVISGTGAQISEVKSNFVLESGTDADGLVSLLTNQDCKYRSGQGLLCRFTALWESNAADSVQAAGFLNDSNCFVFGFNGTEFGIARLYDGTAEIQKLQITSAAAGAENATVTVDGVGYTVPLTSGTVQHNAWEIANSLQSQVPIYLFSSNGDTVTSVDDRARPNGAFAFSSATAVAAWTQIAAGVTPTEDWVPQEDWTNPPDFVIDTTKGNVFQIRIQYLGYGGIRFYMENPSTALIELVHVYEYANANVEPTVEDPTFRVGWIAENRGNTTNLIIRGATAAAFNEGKIHLDERGRAADTTAVTVSTTAVNLLTIRNRIEFDSRVNRIASYIQSMILTADHNRPVVFHLHLGATFIGDLIFSYIDEQNSNMEVAFDNVTCNLDGRDLGSISTRERAPIIVQLQNLVQYLLPGETLTIAAQTDATSGEADGALYWTEDQ